MAEQKLLTMLDEQERVRLIHHRSRAGVVEQQCPSGRPQSLLMSSYSSPAIFFETVPQGKTVWYRERTKVGMILGPVAKAQYPTL